MGYESSEALIFNLVDYSNTSKIITFLSSSRGKIACIAKGINRKNNPWRFFSDRLNLVEIQYIWKTTREVQTLIEMTLLNNYPEIKKDIYRQTLASLLLEYAYYLTPREEKSEKSFTIVRKAFELISNVCIPLYEVYEKIPIFQWSLLKIQGIEPQLTYCCNCGIPVNKISKFSFMGGIVCDKCPYHALLSKEEVSVLHSISQMNISGDLQPINIQNQTLKKLVLLLCDYSKFHTEQEIKSLRVYRELFD
ncbi:MAG: DNA repair protein RecO [Candidatus Hydrogenedentes bacterium]|nr:DNA repair protein RecO [Candidatus Hydrogenedentota bacterium]